MTDKCVIVGAKRTPFGKYLGSLSEMEPLDLAVHAGRAALIAQG
jgi:acetyl-CoA C-acetyltransferase